MNCAECKDLLIAYIEGFLDESQKLTLAEHLKGCRICQAELKEVQRLQQRLLQNGQTLARINVEDEVMNRVIRQQSVQLKKAVKENSIFELWRLFIKSPVARIAFAASIVLVCLAGLYLWFGTNPNVALADVLAKVEQVQAFMYKMKMTMTGNMMPGMPAGSQEMQGTIIISNDYGMKMEMDMIDPNTGKKMTQQMYVLPSRKAIFMIMPEMKRFIKMEFNDDLLIRMKKQNNDPREMIKQILSCKYTEVGRSEINGVEVEGFETTDPAFAGGTMENVKVKLWVDVETWMPIQVNMDAKMNEQMQMQCVIYDYQWNIPVDAGEFEPLIPEDFTAFPTEGVKMPEISEEAAIKGLKLFAELSGRYPENLNIANLMQETVKLKDSNSPAAERIRQELEACKTEEEKASKILEIMKPIQSLGVFYMALAVDKKEPAYYGKTVTPADTDKVLLRWKISVKDYQVIFGDLRMEIVAAEKLAELEGGLPK